MRKRALVLPGDPSWHSFHNPEYAEGARIAAKYKMRMGADWSVPAQDQPSAAITPFSAESLGSMAWFLGTNSSASTVWPSGNFAIYIPFIISVPTLISGGAIANGATASGNVDMGIYDDQGNRLISKGSTAQAGTSGWQLMAFGSITLNPGNYYMAMTCSNGVATVQQVNVVAAEDTRCLGVLGQASALPLPATATFAPNATMAAIPLFGLFTPSPWIWI